MFGGHHMRELDGAGLEGYIAHIGAEGFFTPEGKLAVIAEARPPHLPGDIEYMQNRPVLHDVYAKGAVRLISVPVYAFGGEMESLNFYRFHSDNWCRFISKPLNHLIR